MTDTAWISKLAFESIVFESQRAFPKETGGILIGYWSSARPSEVVISTAVGPGPKAIHHETSFTPDDEYQRAEIARQYFESNNTLAYLGDWHTHPSSENSTLSQRDRRTLRRISAFKPARIATPLMIILAGHLGEWRISVWKAETKRIGPWVIDMKTAPMVPEIF